MDGLSRWLPRWAENEARYVPHAATWLNGERWNDEPAGPVGARSSGPDPLIAELVAFATKLRSQDPTLEARARITDGVVTLRKWRFGDGEIGVRFAAAMRGAGIENITPPLLANMPRFDRFQGPPAPQFTGDPVDWQDAFERAYQNQKWVQR